MGPHWPLLPLLCFLCTALGFTLDDPNIATSPPPATAARVCNAATDCGALPPPSLSSSALSACAASCSTLLFPPHSAFLVSSIDLSNTSGLTLQFGEGATITATPNASLYPIAPFFPPMGNTTCYRAVIFGRNVTNLTLRGPPSAILDGGGAPWQPLRPSLPHQAPKLLELVDVAGLRVEGLTFLNSANWHIHIVFGDDILFSNVTVLGNRSWGGTDGIDPHSCTNMVVEGAHIDVGDDAMAVTSGAHDLTKKLLPSHNITVRNTNMVARNFAIGSGTYANVSEVVVEDCTIGDEHGSAPWAIKIKSHCPYGGVVENVTFQRLKLGHIRPNAYEEPEGGYALAIYANYGSSGLCEEAVAGEAPSPFSPTLIRNISFVDIVGLSAVWAANPIAGVPHGNPISGLLFRNVSFGPTSASRPWICSNVSGTRAEGVEPPLPAECLRA